VRELLGADVETWEEASQHGERMTVTQQEKELCQGDTGLGSPQH